MVEFGKMKSRGIFSDRVTIKFNQRAEILKKIMSFARKKVIPTLVADVKVRKVGENCIDTAVNSLKNQHFGSEENT